MLYAKRIHTDDGLVLDDARMPNIFPPDHPFAPLQVDPDVVSMLVVCTMPDIQAERFELDYDAEEGAAVMPSIRDLAEQSA